MKTTLRRTAGVLGGAALAFAAVATSTPAAHANPNWILYNEGTSAPLTSTDVLTATGSIVIGATIAGSPNNITCTFTTANPLKVTATGPFSGAPGSTLTVNATPPPSLTCQNQAGVQVPVTTTGTWGVSFTVPAAGTSPGQLYDGVLTGTLNVPANGVSADLSNIATGCSATGPTAAKAFSGSYNAHSGVVTANANQGFGVTATGCVVTSTRLSSASLTANPIIDLQW
ncbi:hypothetical protein GCM10022237_00850 [Nocardioides ginsengisoli]|uniref:Neocarzinostatin family protein n=1 Tax=Nocardioides ginsengisoli TaxID=363868 RepID=A0ABW3W3Y6_9ACTN